MVAREVDAWNEIKGHEHDDADEVST